MTRNSTALTSVRNHGFLNWEKRPASNTKKKLQKKSSKKEYIYIYTYLKPKVVFGLVRHFSVIIADVAFPDQAVDGSLVGVGAVPQHSAVVEAKFVL